MGYRRMIASIENLVHTLSTRGGAMSKYKKAIRQLKELDPKERDLVRLVELKKQQEAKKSLDEKTLSELHALLKKYPHLSNLSSSALQATVLLIDGQVFIKQMIHDYHKKFSNTPGYEEPNIHHEKAFFKFATLEEAHTFFLEQAENNRIFTIIDAVSNTIVAYANGDGKLYHSDGKEFAAQDTFMKSKIPADSFHIPEQAISPGKSRG